MSLSAVSLPAAHVTLIDLRPQELRFAEPLERLLPGHAVRAVALAAIEQGQHGLTPADGPLLVLCERGLRSPLAARFLQADGLSAEVYPGGVPALKRALLAQTTPQE
ncbi:MAG: rhodanese-like domain-containing protein [Deinococcus sp.]|nr:rhodanese-like domain-containing protein [Deinococcus sp.]